VGQELGGADRVVGLGLGGADQVVGEGLGGADQLVREDLGGAPAGKQRILCAHSIFSFATGASGAGNAVTRSGGGSVIHSISALDAVRLDAVRLDAVRLDAVRLDAVREEAL